MRLILRTMLAVAVGLASGCGGGGGGQSTLAPVSPIVTAIVGPPAGGATGTMTPAPGTVGGGATSAPAMAAASAAPVTATAAPILAQSNALYPNPTSLSSTVQLWSSSSPLNQPVSSNPTYLANSAAIVAAQFPNGANPSSAGANEAGQYDYAHPIFFASSTDPLVTLKCLQYCGAPDNGGIPASIRIPAKARPAGGTDAHMTVVQPGGVTIDFWALTGTPGWPGGQNTWPNPPKRAARDWQTGDTAYAGSISNCGSLTGGLGLLLTGPGPTAADICARGGTVTAAELISGQINHAVDVAGACAVGSQYPTPAGASTDQCTSGLGPPLGGRMWYDVPCATTRAMAGLYTWERGVLCALNIYGGYLVDDAGGGANFTGGVYPEVESEEPWYDYNGSNYTSPFAALAAQGWSSISIPNANGTASGTRWQYNNGTAWNPAGVNFAQHIHWLAPCSAQGSC